MTYDTIKRVGTAVFVLGSSGATLFLAGKSDRENRRDVYEAQRRRLDENLIAPSNATFATIWPVLYFGLSGLAIHQALPSQKRNHRYRQARPWLLASFAFNALFGYYFSQNSQAARIRSSLITIANLLPVIKVHQALEIGGKRQPQPERIWQKFVGGYAGWLTVATIVRGGNLLIEYGYHPSSTKSVQWASIVLPATVLLGATVECRLKNPAYLLPFVTGFTGIAAKQAGKEPIISKIATIGAFALGGWIARRLTHKSRK